ncbi:hypothetical protein IWQ54_002214 [Labrenzia sp. EL_195]|nr:hypothetical protein [Labrenzia sp. EL_195]
MATLYLSLLFKINALKEFKPKTFRARSHTPKKEAFCEENLANPAVQPKLSENGAAVV